MFKKKPNIKPLAPLRSSDRRRTADKIISDYGLENTAPQSGTEDKAAITAQHTSLRNSLLPDNVQSARFTTTHGPDLKQVSGTVYVGSHPNEDVRILWFKIEEQMYPSVYTLWRHPRIVPLLHTPGIVVKKMQAGADLMTPGLAGPPFPPRARKGAVVAVASVEQPSVPVAVGTCVIDISTLGSVQGAKGHAVQTMHWAGDEIWSYSTSGKSGTPTPEELVGWLTEDVNVGELAGKTEELDIEDEDDGGVALNQVSSSTNIGRGGELDVENAEVATNQAEVKEMTTKEIDEAFRNAFIYGAYHYMTTNSDQANHGLVYPLTQSFVMSNLIQPFLPTFTPELNASLQIKKTSYKNLKKFIKTLDKEKIVKSKERDGHETTILDIDFQDPAIQGFKPYRLPKKETANGPNAGRGATNTIDTSDSSIGQKLTITQYFKPKERLVPLFASANATSSSFFTSAEIRPIITAYIESENLISATNKRLVTLNPTLANSVFDGSAHLDREVQAKGSVPRDALMDRIVQTCSTYYAITRTPAGSTTPDTNEKPKSGSPPKVKITLETRSGNKTATKVSGLETYFIPPQPLADELRKTCAGSTSVEQLVGSSPKHPVMEIMIQGPQKDAVLKALEKRGVRSSWVEVLDKTKGKKK